MYKSYIEGRSKAFLNVFWLKKKNLNRKCDLSGCLTEIEHFGF